MKRVTISLLSLSMLLAQTALCEAAALPIRDDAEKAGFSADSKITEEDLSGMRGGLQIGDIKFDFIITTQTFVNGSMQYSALVQSLGNNIVTRVNTSTQNLQQDISNKVNNEVANISSSISNNVSTNENNNAADISNTSAIDTPLPPIGSQVQEQVQDLIIEDLLIPDVNGAVPNSEIVDDVIPASVPDNLVPEDIAIANHEPAVTIDNMVPDNGTSPNNTGVDQLAAQVLPALQNIVQIGDGNSVTMEAISNTNTVLTVIQNTTDNAVIQQFNQLDLTVTNYNAAQNIDILQHMNFEAVQALH